ncbi:MAG: SAM-dependent methyltransferase [Woeseia sp.]|nr:SAM-dependent methyltransferase [Woeseia sp.]
MITAAQKHFNLPSPDEDSVAHSRLVADHIHQKIIETGGSISFAEYMHEVLYAQGLGYYASGTAKLGLNGDFVTGPEISSLYGCVLATQFASLRSKLDSFCILELGAGSGELVVQMLRHLAVLDSLPEEYLILEVSADLMERQHAKLVADIPDFIDRVRWVAQLPADFSGIVIANEVADAITVERFRIENSDVLQGRVVSFGESFNLVYESAPAFLEQFVRKIEADLGGSLNHGFQSEVSPALHDWIKKIAASVEQGIVLIIDYGATRREYYAPDRCNGWLQCHFRHHVHGDAFILPGIQDLTAWVDFSGLAEAAVAAGMEVVGFADQANFLLNGGILNELKDFSRLSPERQIELSGQVKRLTLPEEMGENFKLMGLSRGNVAPFPAFAGCDKTHYL